uniref:Reverse transcriptase domain-containing protein n=1 Tax=Nicotiana tabacum TaxID=4097 RepID=A0A1S4AVY5_TOBAC|nr:PREDICTED: uncharacterized protein LOC107801860 [Nicotiana tabacum]
MVRAFFNGQELPKYVTHTNLVLLPKKNEVTTFSDLRPIILSNFTNKIISKVIHERLVGFLLNIISEEQARFVKGRSIVENVLLTQEIITDIRLRTKAGPNVVIELDMTKVYDRLSWLFLTKVLRKMGFGERFIGLVFGIVSNNWYSVVVNGQPCGFFKSSRGVKQGDPLSPTLFILAAEALSRDATSLKLVMEVLTAYEEASGQLVNKSKSALYMHHSADVEVVTKVERITRIGRKEFHFTYLGFPIFYARRKMDYYQDLITKVMDKLQAWKGKLLSIGGSDGEGGWNVEKSMEILPEEFVVHILEKIKPPIMENTLDVPYWMLKTRGNFSVKSVWEYLRRRNDPTLAYKVIWVKGLPFKIAFFMWKVWKNKLPLDDFMRRLGYCMPSKCWYCIEPKEESLIHLFFTSHAAKIVWKYFLSRQGIRLEGLTLHQAITSCWTVQVLPRIKPIMQALPSCIIWELWKRRNNFKYGEAVLISRVIYQVSSSLQAIVRVRKPCLINVPHKWKDLLTMLENYTPRMKYDKVIWELPMVGWVKVNTDGASRGNPGRSSIGLCIRNDDGDLVYVLGREINAATNTKAEIVAILEALRICSAHNYMQVWLQTDSLLLKNIVEVLLYCGTSGGDLTALG